MKSSKIVILTLFISCVTFAQEKLLKGRIVADGNNVSGINLMNLVNEKSAITDENGEFLILAKEEDMLIFSSENFYYKRKIIEADDLKKGIIIIEMEPKPIQIEEVVITQYAHLTAYGLGIINYIPKRYTVAERRMVSKVGSYKERKAQLEGEKKLMLIESLEMLFDDNYFVETLKINPDYIMGFKYYCSEDKEFAKLVKVKNEDDITLAIIKLAEEYNNLQQEESSKE